MGDTGIRMYSIFSGKKKELPMYPLIQEKTKEAVNGEKLQPLFLRKTFPCCDWDKEGTDVELCFGIPVCHCYSWKAVIS